MIHDLRVGDKVFCKKDATFNIYGKDIVNPVYNLSIKKNHIYEIIDINKSIYVYYIYIKVLEHDEINTLELILFDYISIMEKYSTFDFIKKSHYHDTFYSFEDYFLTNNEYRKQKLDKILNLYE